MLFAAAWGLVFFWRGGATVATEPQTGGAPRGLASVLLLLTGIACCGAAWHHLRWSALAAADLSRFAEDVPRPARLIGIAATEPRIVRRQPGAAASAIPQYDRTLCTVEPCWLVAADRKIAVAGLARLEVSGHLLDVHAGDEVEVLGKFSLPAGALNPGGFDFREQLRAAGIRTLVRSDSPDCLRVVRTARWWNGSWRGKLQRACENVVATRLDAQSAPLGIALLLGARTGISDELRTQFAESGAMHMLAISGINVGILAAFLWTCCRLLRIGDRWAIAATIAGLLAYATVTEGQPPVIRATIMLTVWLAGSAFRRTSSPQNLLAVALLLVLWWNPSDLFEIGPQLSFLAVLALIWSSRRVPFTQDAAPVSPEELDLGEQPLWRRALGSVAAWLATGYRTTAAVWLLTLPLILARFNLVSPVGFLTDVLLMPWLALTLWMGYGLLIAGLLVPPFAFLFARTFEAGLAGLVAVVGWAGALPWGHFYVPGPTNWWLAGFYLLLAVIVFAPRGHFSLKRVQQPTCAPSLSKGGPGGVKEASPDVLGNIGGGSRPLLTPPCKGGEPLIGRKFAPATFASWGWRAIAVWTLVGLVAGLPHHLSDELRCTFLAVGHGGAILVEFPSGEALLYDAGSLQNPERARQTIQAALWQRGRTRLDGVVISHADVDHFNAVAGLLHFVRVERLFVAPSFLDFHQTNVVNLCEAAWQAGVPIELIWRGDRLATGGTTAAQVLHPAARERLASDNAQSVALAIEYAGRRILLTGDLDGDGLAELLRQERATCDILLAPHHGSAKPNGAALAAWARPRWVVVSGGTHDTARRLQDVYGLGADVLSTSDNGAVSFRINSQGDVALHTFRASPSAEQDVQNLARHQ